MFAQARKCISTWPMSHRSQSHSWLCWSQYVFFTIGFLAVSYVSLSLLESSLFQAYHSWQFERATKSLQTPTGGADFRPQTLPVDREGGNDPTALCEGRLGIFPARLFRVGRAM